MAAMSGLVNGKMWYFQDLERTVGEIRDRPKGWLEGPGQTVNQPSYDFEGSSPSSPTNQLQ
jgi:hypothetical protein